MKNQYFGDIHDYHKYALLRALSGYGELRTLVVWLLTPDDATGHGARVGYFQEPERWRDLDPEIFNWLWVLHQIGSPAGLVAVEGHEAIPRGRFFFDMLPDGAAGRARYFDEVGALYSKADWVFFDPDNGLEVESCRYGTSGSSRYLYWRELAEAYAAGVSVMVYQHFPRQARESFVAALVERAEAETGGEAAALVTPDTVFLLVMQERHRAYFWKRIAHVIEGTGRRFRLWMPDAALQAPNRRLRALPEVPTGPVITDTEGLVAADVSGRRVVCPACQTHTFRQWPSGWDAHAAHRCSGVTGATGEARKRTFKERWRHLFNA